MKRYERYFLFCFRIVLIASPVVIILLPQTASSATGAPPTELAKAIYSGNTQIVARYLKNGGYRGECVPIRSSRTPAAGLPDGHWCMGLGPLLVSKGYMDLAKLALSKNSENRRDQIQVALGTAIRADLPDFVENLIKHGASVNRWANGSRPLPLAAGIGNLRIVKDLVRSGAHVNTVDSAGYTSIGVALEAGNEIVAEYLVRHGATLDMKTTSGEGLISLATEGGAARFITALAIMGFDVNSVDSDGFTPLFLALDLSDSKRKEVVKVLLRYGANACYKLFGHTALYYAKKRQEFDIEKMLEKAESACQKP